MDLCSTMISNPLLILRAIAFTCPVFVLNFALNYDQVWYTQGERLLFVKGVVVIM